MMKSRLSFFGGLIVCFSLICFSLTVVFQSVVSLKQSIHIQESQENQLWMMRLFKYEENSFAQLINQESPQEQLNKTLERFLDNDFLISAKLYNLLGNLLASQQKEINHLPTSIYIAPLYIQNSPIGFLEIHYQQYQNHTFENSMNLSFIHLAAQGIIVFLFGGGSFCLVLLIGYCFYKRIKKRKQNTVS